MKLTRRAKWLALLLAIPTAGWALTSVPNVWNNAVWEQLPDGVVEPANLIDENINLLKEEVRRRAEVEHHFGIDADAGETAGSDNGLHRIGSARCFIQITEPTVIEQKDYDNIGVAPFVNSNILSDISANSISSERIGTGRCWWNSLTRVLYIHNGLVWLPTHPSASTVNLLPNSQFSETDTTSTDVPSGGWALLGATTPGLAYASRPNSEGYGLEIQITASGAVDEGIQYTHTGLKPTTQYWMVGRVQSAVGDTCSMRFNTSGGTDVVVSNTGTGVVEVVDSLVTTDATPTGEIIELESNAAADICEWSSVGLFELVSPLRTPGIPTQVSYDTDTGVAVVIAGTATVANVDPEMTIPGGGGTLIAEGSVVINQTNSADILLFEIRTAINGGGATTCTGSRGSFQSGITSTNSGTVFMQCVIRNPTPGNRYVFTMFLTESAGNSTYGGASLDQSLSVIWYPPGA